MITNDVSDYINILVRIVHIICNHSVCATVKGRTKLLKLVCIFTTVLWEHHFTLVLRMRLKRSESIIVCGSHFWSDANVCSTLSL